MTELEQQLQVRLDKAVEVFKQMKADMAKKDEEIASLNKQLEETTNNVNSELIVQLEEGRTEADKMVDELTAENKKLHEQLEQEVQRLEKWRQTVTEMEMYTNELNSKIGELNLVIQTLKKEKEESTKSINEFKLEIADKDLKINTQTEEYDELLTANKGYKNDLKELTDNYLKLHEQHKAVSGRILELEGKLADLSAESVELDNRLTITLNDNAKLFDDFTAVKDSYEVLENDYKKLQEQYEYLRNSKEDETATFDNLTNKVKVYERGYYMLKEIIKDIDSSITPKDEVYNNDTVAENKNPQKKVYVKPTTKVIKKPVQNNLSCTAGAVKNTFPNGYVEVTDSTGYHQNSFLPDENIFAPKDGFNL